MCLTGVDYFSSLGYQPGIAALAAGALAPLATIVLVLVTLCGALPMYRWVAGESPHGDGSISMLAGLLPWWQGKLFVLVLIGFVATGFVITITLSAADAAAHIAENPFTRAAHGYEVVVTLLLIALLGAVFLKGFNEAIGIAVALVGIYLALNVVVIAAGAREIVRHPHVVVDCVLAAWLIRSKSCTDSSPERRACGTRTHSQQPYDNVDEPSGHTASSGGAPRLVDARATRLCPGDVDGGRRRARIWRMRAATARRAASARHVSLQ